MLWQLHWQYIKSGKTIKTEIQAQRDVNSVAEMQTFCKDTQKSHPIVDDAIWMACNKELEHFVFARRKD